MYRFVDRFEYKSTRMDAEKCLKNSSFRIRPWSIPSAFTDDGKVILVEKRSWPNNDNDRCRHAHRTIGKVRQPVTDGRVYRPRVDRESHFSI